MSRNHYDFCLAPLSLSFQKKKKNTLTKSQKPIETLKKRFNNKSFLFRKEFISINVYKAHENYKQINKEIKRGIGQLGTGEYHSIESADSH